MLSPAVSLHWVCGFPSLPCLISTAGYSHEMGHFYQLFLLQNFKEWTQKETAGSQVQDLPNEPTRLRRRARSENGIWADLEKIGACVQIGLPTMCMETWWNVSGWWFGTWMSFFHMLGTIIPTDKYFFRGIETTNQDETYVCVPGTFASCNPALLWSENELGDGGWKPCGQENGNQPLDATGFRGAPLSDPR